MKNRPRVTRTVTWPLAIVSTARVPSSPSISAIAVASSAAAGSDATRNSAVAPPCSTTQSSSPSASRNARHACSLMCQGYACLDSERIHRADTEQVMHFAVTTTRTTIVHALIERTAGLFAELVGFDSNHLATAFHLGGDDLSGDLGPLVPSDEYRRVEIGYRCPSFWLQL